MWIEHVSTLFPDNEDLAIKKLALLLQEQEKTYIRHRIVFWIIFWVPPVYNDFAL
jgi:hypothetical protein